MQPCTRALPASLPIFRSNLIRLCKYTIVPSVLPVQAFRWDMSQTLACRLPEKLYTAWRIIDSSPSKYTSTVQMYWVLASLSGTWIAHQICTYSCVHTFLDIFLLYQRTIHLSRKLCFWCLKLEDGAETWRVSKVQNLKAKKGVFLN